MKSNKVEARKKFEARKGIKLPADVTNSGSSLRSNNDGTFQGPSAVKKGPVTSSADRGNYLRKKHIKELYEAAGFIVVGDPRSQEKYDAGGCNSVMLILGIVYDFTDMNAPTGRLPEEKREQLKGLVEGILDAGTKRYPEFLRI